MVNFPTSVWHIFGGNTKELASSLPLKETVSLPFLTDALMQVITSEGIQGSNSALFKGAIFGRDSLRVALDLLPWYPEIARKVIVSLARIQGTENNLVNEEEPGRIPHEYRSLYVGAERISESEENLLNTLASQWGWQKEGESLCYYGSVDATPQFIRLVHQYWSTVDASILNQIIIDHRGQTRTIAECFDQAVDWLEKRLLASDIHLLEFCRSNPQGHRWQVLRDGATAYIHPDGSLANFTRPIASIEVQGLAYDALIMASKIYEDKNPDRSRNLSRLATQIQIEVIDRFWLPKEQFFAMAIDRDQNGTPRVVPTITSLPSELLITRIFDSLPTTLRKKYLTAIISKMYSGDFLTSVGIRSRSLCHAHTLDYWDYQGTCVSWPVMTNIFAIGLRRQGFIQLALDMEQRIITGVAKAGSLPEFFYVAPDGKVSCKVQYQAPQVTKNSVTIMATNLPEAVQAWTVSAALRSRLAKKQKASKPSSFSLFESKILMKHSRAKFARKKPFHDGATVINHEEGIRREQALLNRSEY